MEKGELIPVGMMVMAYAVMIAARQLLTEPYASIIGYGSVFIFIGGTVAQEVYAQLHLAGVSNFYATVQPSNSRIELFYKSFESLSLGSNRFRTTLHLGFPFSHPHHGTVDKVFIYHCLPWLARVRLNDGYASYLGVTVQHSQTDLPTLFEKTPLEDHAKFYPVYEMVLAGGDFPYMAFIIEEGFKARPDIVKEMISGIKQEKTSEPKQEQEPKKPDASDKGDVVEKKQVGEATSNPSEKNEEPKKQEVITPTVEKPITPEQKIEKPKDELDTLMDQYLQLQMKNYISKKVKGE